MTRKHYEAAAEVLRLHTDRAGEAGQAARDIAYGLAKMFQADNERFDTARFLIAAGVIGGTL